MKQVNVIVKTAFRDRYSGKHYKQGDKLTISDARYREIKRCGDYVQVVQPAHSRRLRRKTSRERTLNNE